MPQVDHVLVHTTAGVSLRKKEAIVSDEKHRISGGIYTVVYTLYVTEPIYRAKKCRVSDVVGDSWEAQNIWWYINMYDM